jgi:hypothetical protein
MNPISFEMFWLSPFVVLRLKNYYLPLDTMLGFLLFIDIRKNTYMEGIITNKYN